MLLIEFLLMKPTSGHRHGLTVHPLGGAIMSSDGTGRNGTTNHIGQLFTGAGTEVHEGLVCVDGSVIPTALGKVFPPRTT